MLPIRIQLTPRVADFHSQYTLDSVPGLCLRTLSAHLTLVWRLQDENFTASRLAKSLESIDLDSDGDLTDEEWRAAVESSSLAAETIEQLELMYPVAADVSEARARLLQVLHATTF